MIVFASSIRAVSWLKLTSFILTTLGSPSHPFPTTIIFCFLSTCLKGFFFTYEAECLFKFVVPYLELLALWHFLLHLQKALSFNLSKWFHTLEGDLEDFLFCTFDSSDGPDGTYTPCCVGTSDTRFDCDVALAVTSSVGHWEGVNGGKGLEALTLPVQLLFSFCKI